MPTNQVELLRAARNLERLRNKARKLRRQLKENAKDIRLEKKHLKVLVDVVNELDSDIIPSRVFGGGVGYKPRRKSKTENNSDEEQKSS